MSQYRIFAIGPDGHITDATLSECSNDEQAIEQAQRLQGDRDLDIWDGARLVASLRRKRTTPRRNLR
jgi:hypothetical protein